MTSDLPYLNRFWLYDEQYVRYLRAVIHEELGQDEEALRWYGSLGPAGWPMSQGGLLYLAPKHLRMGEIHEKLGNREQAVQHYARFVDLWKNCDPELRPLVDDAKARIEQLKEDPG